MRTPSWLTVSTVILLAACAKTFSPDPAFQAAAEGGMPNAARLAELARLREAFEIVIRLPQSTPRDDLAAPAFHRALTAWLHLWSKPADGSYQAWPEPTDGTYQALRAAAATTPSPEAILALNEWLSAHDPVLYAQLSALAWAYGDAVGAGHFGIRAAAAGPITGGSISSRIIFPGLPSVILALPNFQAAAIARVELRALHTAERVARAGRPFAMAADSYLAGWRQLEAIDALVLPHAARLQESLALAAEELHDANQICIGESVTATDWLPLYLATDVVEPGHTPGALREAVAAAMTLRRALFRPDGNIRPMPADASLHELASALAAQARAAGLAVASGTRNPGHVPMTIRVLPDYTNVLTVGPTD